MGKKILVLCMVIALLILLPVFSYAFTNEIPISTDANGAVFNGVGYQSGYRLNSSGTLSVASGSYVTGFIPVKFGDTVYMQDVTFQYGVTSGLTSTNQRMAFYDSDKNLIGVSNASAYLAFNAVLDSNDSWTEFTVKSPANVDLSNTAYFRLNGSYIGTDSVISVNEEIPVFRSVTVSSSFGGSASADVATSYEGQTVTLTANPNPDYYFQEWEVLSGDVDISNNRFSMPDEDVSIKAIFAPIVYDISVTSSSGGSASADLSNASYGQTVTLTATPAAGYTFSEWEVTTGNVSVINNQFIMPRGDVSVKAVFLPIPVYSVTVENDGKGVGSANPTSGYSGTPVTLSAVPVLGYEFDRWEVISGNVSIVNDEFVLPSSNVVLKAHFKPIVYTITLNQGLHGSATVSQDTGIIGDVITLTATPDANYNFSHWNVIEGGVTVDGDSFIMPASNVVIQPVFLELGAVSSGFEYHSGALPGEEEIAFTTIDVDFGEQPAGEYLINIYHWGSGCIPTFQISYNGKYLPFVTSGGSSTVAIEHDGGSLVLDGSLSLVKNLLQSAEGTVVISGQYSTGHLQFHSLSSWTFNIEDIVLIPAGISDTEDFGFFSSLVSFLKGQMNEIKSFLTVQIGRIAGDEQAESDVSKAEDELNKEVEDLNNLGGQLEEQQTSLETQLESDFKVSDEITSQTSTFQGIYSGIFSSFGIFSIFIWLPVVLAVIKKLLRL